jgi:hypothetical protein
LAVKRSGVLAVKTIVAISAGGPHSLVLSSDGSLYAWGDNGFGQLGNGTTTGSRVPVAVDTSGVLSGKAIIAVVTGKFSSMALSSDGKVCAWGLNSHGEIGDGTTTDRYVPVAVDTSGVLAGKIVTAISAGMQYALVRASDGECPRIRALPCELSNGTVSDSCSRVITASGGTGSYGFRVVAGALPPGLTLSRKGVLSGTPSTQGSFNFAVRATDAMGCSGRTVYTLQICPLITL